MTYWILLDSSSSSPWSCQGCWAGLNPQLDFVQWLLSEGKLKLGFTPVCTMAKELAVALASNHLTITENFQAPTFTATEVSWSIIKGQCYIRKVRAESVCPTFHLRMFSDSGTISPGPGWPDWEIENLRMRIILPWTVTIQCNGMGGTSCCWTL